MRLHLWLEEEEKAHAQTHSTMNSLSLSHTHSLFRKGRTDMNQRWVLKT